MKAQKTGLDDFYRKTHDEVKTLRSKFKKDMSISLKKRIRG